MSQILHCKWNFVCGIAENVTEGLRSSPSSTEVNIAKVKEMVTESRHLSSKEIAAELSVSHELIRTILTIGHEKRCYWTSSERLSHKAIIVNEFVAKNSTNIINQPPYTPDMALANF